MTKRKGALTTQERQARKLENINKMLDAIRPYAKSGQEVRICDLAGPLGIGVSAAANYVGTLIASGRIRKLGPQKYAMGDGTPPISGPAQGPNSELRFIGPVKHRPMPSEPPAFEDVRAQLMSGRARAKRISVQIEGAE